jgi:hypothetical protein
MRNIYTTSPEKLEGKRTPERTRCRWDDNITMDLK